ncbi:hypothetical protein QBC38DRAFT_454713 [Podospora fimiseda]|uniref:Uncharacterized protein n=1 Tax=Podospora fimiseda TaxID=252190 RepID=A0AAN7GVQ5_9PEZI|nr:hypothetical protein QBC38DRAFT_454713 [Podospora fimiseda]
MRGSGGDRAAAVSQGLTFFMRKRLKNVATSPLEITERRQVGDAEALFGGAMGTTSDGSTTSRRGKDSEL